MIIDECRFRSWTVAQARPPVLSACPVRGERKQPMTLRRTRQIPARGEVAWTVCRRLESYTVVICTGTELSAGD
jgi:hypothetical protein